MDMETQKINLSEVIGHGYNEFWNNKDFYRVVKGSRGSKKSRTTGLNFIWRIMRYKWSNLIVVRRYSNTNRQSTYTELKWAIHRLNVDSLFKCNDGMPEITYIPTGQKILFRGLDDPLKITSTTVTTGILSWVWLEEAYEIETSDKMETLVESIRGIYDDPEFFKQVTITFNPWSDQHWLKPTFFDEATRKKNTWSYTTTFRINEWLGQDDKDRYLDLYRTNPRRARIVCDGEWGIAEGLVFENFIVEDFDIQEVIKQSTGTCYGMDFGFTHDPTTFSASAINMNTKDIYIFDELYGQAMLTDDIYKWLDENQYLKSEIYADSAEPRLIAELRNKGVRRIQGSWKGNDSIMTGINFLQGFKVHILPKCTNAIQEFNTYVFDQDKNGKWLNKPVDLNNHFMDAWRYSIEKYILKEDTSTNRTNQTKTLANLGLI
jgi:phage terminase large subunit